MSPCHHVSTGLPAYSCTRRFVAEVSLGSGLNHTSPPFGSRIIGPAWPGPVYGATNSSPGAAAGELRGHGDRRRLQVRARAEALHFARAARVDRLGRGADRVLAGDRELVEQRLRGAAGVAAARVTVTRSPSANGRAGTKLAPSPCEYAAQAPACAPVREPTTLTALSSPDGTPRKLICVCGEASRLPGSGDTVTDPSCSAELFEARRVARRRRVCATATRPCASTEPQGRASALG